MTNDENLTLSGVPVVKVAMGIRKPPSTVFAALVDPEITTKFWFTKSSGRVETGATLTWQWEMYDASADVVVSAVDVDSRILLEWGGGGGSALVEFTLTPWGPEWTYVQVTESGFAGSGDEAVAWLADSTGGFAMVLCALKAYVEHGVELSVVADHRPPGLLG